jgi:hypothetical protein
MTEIERNKFTDKITVKMRELMIASISNGYKSAWETIIQMINEGKTKKQIKEYGEWVLKNNGKITNVAIDNKEKE